MSLDVCLTATRPTTVFESNITHNLGAMASEAGLYQALWRPEDTGITKASELLPLLRKGLEQLRAEPDHFIRMNPPNHWGSYDGLVSFVAEYLTACEENPDAIVSVSR